MDADMQDKLVRYRPWLGLLIRLGLGVVWIVAALDKLGDPRTFTQAVRAYDATPEWLSQGIGYGLPVLEFCVGVLLVAGLVTRLAAIASGGLFLVFLIGLIQAAARGIQLECGCFGGGGATSGGTTYTWDILRDIGLLILAAFLVWWPATHLSVDEFLARNDGVEMPSAKRMRTDQGRRKYNAMLESRKQAARQRTLWLNASMAAVIVLVAIIGVGVQKDRAKISGSLQATNASVTNGVVYGKKAAATVDVYEDFQCPHCLEFESTSGGTVQADVLANKAQVRYHMLSFLDGSSDGNNYSSRAANAALCASDISVDAFVALHKVLFTAAVQPTEGSNGRTNKQLESYGARSGIKGSDLTTFDTCVEQQTHKALVQAIQDKASRDGINSTPTIKVNGKTINPTTAAFTKAVDAALKNGPKPDPSPTKAASSSPAPGSSSTLTGSPIPGSGAPSSGAPSTGASSGIAPTSGAPATSGAPKTTASAPSTGATSSG